MPITQSQVDAINTSTSASAKDVDRWSQATLGITSLHGSIPTSPEKGTFPTDSTPAVRGYLFEADFMKFRGRGYIQTTGLANYSRMIEFVKSYSGENNTIDFYALQWRDLSADVAADRSSNDDWDQLFTPSDLTVPARAIGLHNETSGDYLTLSGDPDQAVRNMGKRITAAMGRPISSASMAETMDRVTSDLRLAKDLSDCGEKLCVDEGLVLDKTADRYAQSFRLNERLELRFRLQPYWSWRIILGNALEYEGRLQERL
jgi:hypothetical protein